MLYSFVLSTPKKYMEALKLEASYNELKFPVIKHDFLPL